MLKKLVIYFSIYLFSTSFVRAADSSEEDTKNGAVVKLGEHGDWTFKKTIFLKPIANNVEISGQITINNMKNAKFTVHIHEKGLYAPPLGDMVKPDCSGFGKLVENIGNFDLDDQGSGLINLKNSQIKFDGHNSIIGKALVVHISGGSTESTGVLCGVIEKKEYPASKNDGEEDKDEPDSGLSLKMSYFMVILNFVGIIFILN